VNCAKCVWREGRKGKVKVRKREGEEGEGREGREGVGRDGREGWEEEGG